MDILSLIVNQGAIEKKGKKTQPKKVWKPKEHVTRIIVILEFPQEKIGILNLDVQGTWLVKIVILKS